MNKKTLAITLVLDAFFKGIARVDFPAKVTIYKHISKFNNNFNPFLGIS